MTSFPHLKLQLERSSGGVAFEGHFGPEHLAPFATSLAALLQHQQVLRPGEKCRTRIIPRFDDHPNFDKPVELAIAGLADDGLGDCAIACDSLNPPDGRVTYLTIGVLATEALMMYRFDFSLETLFGTTITRAVQHLLDKGALADGDHFRVVVTLSEVGSVSDTGTGKRGGLKGLKWKRKRERHDEKILVEADEPLVPAIAPPPVVAEDFDIVIGQVEEFVKPQPRSMESYEDVEPVGEISSADIPIFVHRTAMKHARESAGTSAKSNEEVGGFFIGSVYRDPETDRMFVDISETVATDRARGTYLSLEFNYDAWRQVLDRVEGDVQDKHLMGWYHTHLVSLGSVEPVEGGALEYAARYITFFSSHDIFIHKNFFPSPWHVGLVLDLRCKQEVFFAWKSGEIKSARGFFLYGK